MDLLRQRKIALDETTHFKNPENEMDSKKLEKLGLSVLRRTRLA